MVKHTQTIRRQKSTNCFSMFDHFVGLALKGLNHEIILFGENNNKPKVLLGKMGSVKC